MSAKEQAIDELIVQVRKFYSSLRFYLRAKLKETGSDLTIEMLQVLRFLFEKDGVNQQEIANAVGKDKTSITYLIDNLAKRKLVKRIEDGADRRNKLIYLTTEGKRLKTVTNKWYDEMYSVACTQMQTAEIKSMIPFFDKIISNLEIRN